MNLNGLVLLLLLNLIFPASTFAKESNKTTRRYLFGFGPTTYSNLNSRSVGTLFTGGYVWDLDPQFDLQAAMDFGTSFTHTDLMIFCPQMKGRYFLSDGESSSSWYAGAGMGIGYTRNHKDGAHPTDAITSMALSASFGVKFYRKTAFPLFVEIEHLMFIKESNYGTPISTSLKVGLSFPEGKTTGRR